MAKKIKFPLEMKDGVSVRTLEELQENFCLEKVLEYFKSGKLQKWLEDRYYEDEIAQLEELEENQEGLARRLAEIFGVEYQEQEEDALDKIMSKQEKLRKLRQYTDDEEILNQAGLAAFDQEELAELLDEDAETIFLCENRFVIPLRKTNRRYVGVGNAVVVIKGKDEIRLDEANIVLDHVTVVCLDGGHVIAKGSKGLEGDVLQEDTASYEIIAKMIPLYSKETDDGEKIVSHKPLEYSVQSGSKALALYRVDKRTHEEKFIDFIADPESIIRGGKIGGIFSSTSDVNRYKEKDGFLVYSKHFNRRYYDSDTNRMQSPEECKGIFGFDLAENRKTQLVCNDYIEETLLSSKGIFDSACSVRWLDIMGVSDNNIVFQIAYTDYRASGSVHILNYSRDREELRVLDSVEFAERFTPVYSDNTKVYYVNERDKVLKCYNMQNKSTQIVALNVYGGKTEEKQNNTGFYRNGYLYYVRLMKEDGDKYFAVKYDMEKQEEERIMELPSGYGYTYSYAFFFEKDGDLFLTYHTSSSFAFVSRDSHTIKIE